MTSQNEPLPTTQPADPRRPRKSRRWLYISSALLLVWMSLSFSLASYLTSRRTPLLAHETPQLLKDAEYENLRLKAKDDLEIGAWYFPGESTKPVLLLLHGNFASRTAAEHQIQWLLNEGYSIMIPSLRAHGDSQGERNDFGYSARLDVITCIDWLKEHQPGKPIVVWGQSLGAAAAIFASPDLGEQVQAYILECPYKDLATAVWNRCQLLFPDFLDAIVYRSLRLCAVSVLPQFDDISPVNAIMKMPPSIPILILAGDADVHARPQEAEAIYEVVKDHSILKIFEGATHMGLDLKDKESYRSMLIDFVNSSLNGSLPN